VLADWREYLAHDNHGRPIVFIGHSQGAAMLIRLLATQIDPSPQLRAQLVSAILLGGNVEVPIGKLVGGSFANIPACQSGQQTGCVIAYSTYRSPPPANSPFGRPGIGVSLMSGQTASAGLEVLCVNPAALEGGSGLLEPYFATKFESLPKITTPWVEFPRLYSAACTSGGGASWLQVSDLGQPGDARPRVNEGQLASWGLHAEDLALASGNLIEDVRAQESAFP
jgi:hypothetical protein